MKIEQAIMSFNVEGTKELKAENGGTNIGEFSGHLAAFAKDRGDDVFMPGAFRASIEDLRSKGRPIRMLRQHDTFQLVGGFPIDQVREDEKGLFVVGHINLDVQNGREAFSLMKQGVLTDMSIGFSVPDHDRDVEIRDGIRFIKLATIWEGSLVTEPMNPDANVIDVKNAVPYQDLPLAARDREWDSTTAISRVRDFTDSTDEPSSSYRRAFLWFDGDNADDFGAYKLPIADVIDGRLTAIPRAIFAAAAALNGGRGGVDIPEDQRAAVIRNVERYYAKMDMESPFEKSDKEYFIAEDVKAWSPRDIESFLKSTGMVSKSAAKYLVKKLSEKSSEKSESIQELLNELKGFKSLVSNSMKT